MELSIQSFNKFESRPLIGEFIDLLDESIDVNDKPEEKYYSQRAEDYIVIFREVIMISSCEEKVGCIE